MFTEQDIKRIKKLNIEYYEKRESESNGSSLMQERSEDDLYFSKYFLNDCFKILHIQIVSTQEVTVSFSRQESYMTYTVMVVTQEFSYEIKKRYSQFLRLYESIVREEQLRNRSQIDPKVEVMNVGKINKLQYTFPPKKLSSSLLTFFNKSNKQKLALERKADLSSFLNQIRNNYYKFPDQFVQHYIELLKFINMKEQHQKYWRRKEGRFLELSNLTLKDTNLPNFMLKNSQKQGESQVNIDHLSELLQHQMNKINLAVTASQSVRKSQFRYSQIQEVNDSNDLMVTNDIIKNVDCIQDIVLEMKRKINYDHIRCILKGKDIKQQSNGPLAKMKKGLIEYSLKHTTNELVSMHILKTVLNVFMNSECNYSCDAFIKILSEIQLSIFALQEEKEEFALQNKQFREVYFKLLKQYIYAREQYGPEKKNSKFPIEKLMGLVLVNSFRAWSEHNDKNKQFKLKDQQKQWTLIIDDSTRYSPKKFNSHSSQAKSAKEETNQQQHKDRKGKELQKFNITKECQFLKMNLIAEKNEEFYSYLLKAEIRNKKYKQCVEIMKDQFKWNPLLIRSQIDIYSHTKKDVMKMPGKQEKIFRFVQNQEIQMDLNDQEEHVLVELENVSHDHDQEDTQQQLEKDPKMSTQTMPSTSGSCAFQHEPQVILKQKSEVLTNSLDSYQTSFIKCPPKEPSILSFNQRIKVERILRSKTKQQLCAIQIQIIFTQSSAMKYFLSQIQGTTLIIWNGFSKAFGAVSEQPVQIL